MFYGGIWEFYKNSGCKLETVEILKKAFIMLENGDDYCPIAEATEFVNKFDPDNELKIGQQNDTLTFLTRVLNSNCQECVGQCLFKQ